MNSPQKQNKLRIAMQKIQGNVNRIFNRVKLARLALKSKLGFVPEGSATYRQLCPKGAGFMSRKRILSRSQLDVGSRKAHRRSVAYMRQFSQTEWGKCLAGA